MICPDPQLASNPAVSVSPAYAPTIERKETTLRPALWMTVATLALMFFGPSFLRLFRPPSDQYADFVQEWLSARNYWAGEPVYLPQRQAMYLHTGQDIKGFDIDLPWNAHPPVTILLALPFGIITDYHTAHLVWNLCTFPLIAFSIWLIFRELRIGWDWAPLVLVVCYLISASPVRMQLFQGQLNTVLLLMLVLGWIADRRGYQVGAGVAIGIATALKFYPALLLISFVAAGRWRSIAAALIIAAGLNGIALAVFGWNAFETYIRQVLPSLGVFRGSWSNFSATGYWTRVGRQFHVPAFGSAAAIASQCAVVAIVAWSGWRIRSVRDRDLAYALAIVGMTLASPVAWGHYFVMLVLPMVLIWYYLPAGPARGLLIAAMLILWLPQLVYPRAILGSEQVKLLTNTHPIPDSPVLCLLALGAIPYALTALFLITARARFQHSAAPASG